MGSAYYNMYVKRLYVIVQPQLLNGKNTIQYKLHIFPFKLESMSLYILCTIYYPV
jgi:hypothetical protein